MKYKSPISIRVGERSELDQRFAKWIKGLPDNAVLSEEIKRCCVENIVLKKEVSDLESIKAMIAHQEKVLRELEAKIANGIFARTTEGESCGITNTTVDDEKIRRAQKLAASMTEW